MDSISLKIKDRKFDVKKDLLCEYSDYFQAMFSGNYVENEQKEICIDTLEPDIMEIILKYMNIGLIDLSEYTISIIGQIAIAAGFLQITELIKQIEYVLDLQLSESNWIDIMAIADQCSYTKLEKLAIVHGLLSFKSMKPEYIPTLQTLSWYLSHPYLDSESELDTFQFGYQWITHHETGADALLIILGCLDITRITKSEILDIIIMISAYKDSLAAKVVECMYNLAKNNHSITTTSLEELKCSISEKFTERVYNELFNLVKNSSTRKLNYTPVIPMWLLKESKPELLPHCLYSYTTQNKFEQWLEVADKNLWGWSVVSWGPSKFIVICGEHGRGTGMFMQDVRVYDILRKEWTRHGVLLPSRRHAGFVVKGDSLYIVGGVGSFRVILDTAIIYDLKQRSFRKIAKFPDAMQSPAVCLHDNVVYSAGHKNIYEYEDLGSTDNWKAVVRTDIRMSCIRSFRKYIYCTQSYFSHLYRFKPGLDAKLEVISAFSSPPATVCNLYDHLIVFTRSVCRQSDTISVEVYRGDTAGEKPKIVYTEADTSMRVNDLAGSCVVITETPPTDWEVSQYLRSYLQHYND
ncbi:kelch-like protein 40b [Zerene cesonia]|uniref:kelch-like protein 40b n=1 Tax=Zerene cesonia TaxID=33412 RepID=UPI0018E53C3C|nr:kelch-like protein 40b [Zerene cesonia]